MTAPKRPRIKNAAPKKDLSMQLDTRLSETRQFAAAAARKKKKRDQIGRSGCVSVRVSKVIIMVVAWWCVAVEDCKPVLVGNGRELRCPSNCVCFEEYKKVLCNNRSFRSLPRDIPNAVEKLTITGGDLRSLEKQALRRLTNLKALRLQRDRIYQIPTTALLGLEGLESLNLSTNKLTRVPQTAFTYLNSLRELSLRNNPITNIIGFNFIQISSSIMKLDLGELRHLIHISFDAFNGLDRLQVLKMDSCNLERIPNVRPLSNLEELDLSANRFTAIGANDFESLTRLTRLRLDSSQIAVISNGAFNDLLLLQFLHLNQNNLAVLAASTFQYNKQLQSLYLQHNPWRCNCAILSLVKYLKDNERLCNGNECPVCQYPTIYQERLITTLSASQSCVSMYAKQGEPAKIPCPSLESNATKSNNIQWYLPDGAKPSDGNKKVRVTKLGNGSLSFNNVLLSDQGMYQCSVTSFNYALINATIYLKVANESDIAMLSSSYFSTSTYSTSTTTASKTQKQSVTNTPTAGYVIATPTTWTNRKTTKRIRPPKTTRTTRKSTTPNLLPKRTSTTSKTTTTQQWSTTSRVVINSPLIPKGKDTNTNQVLETTNVIIACFVGLTLIAAAFLVIIYKMRRRNFNSSEQNSVDFSDDKRTSVNDNLNVAKTCFPPPHDDLLSSPEQRNRGSKGAMARSVTSTWVASLPESSNERVNLPTSAVRVLPPTIEEFQKGGTFRGNKLLSSLKPDQHSPNTAISRTMKANVFNNRHEGGHESINTLLPDKILCDLLDKSQKQQSACKSDLQRPNTSSISCHNAAALRQQNQMTKQRCNAVQRFHSAEGKESPARPAKPRPKSCTYLLQHNENGVTNHVRFKNDNGSESNYIQPNGASKHTSKVNEKMPVKLRSFDTLFSHKETVI